MGFNSPAIIKIETTLVVKIVLIKSLILVKTFNYSRLDYPIV